MVRRAFSRKLHWLSELLGRVPLVNMYVTCVPWSGNRLHIDEHPMVGLLPIVPPMLGAALTCAAVTYKDQLHVGISCDPQTTPDLDGFMHFLDQSYEKLCSATDGA